MSNYNREIREQQDRILSRNDSHNELPNLPNLPIPQLQRQVAQPDLDDYMVHNSPPHGFQHELPSMSQMVLPDNNNNNNIPPSVIPNLPPPSNPPPAPRYNRSRRYAFFLDNINNSQEIQDLRTIVNMSENNDNGNVTETESISSDYSTSTDYDDDEKEDFSFLSKLLDKIDKEKEKNEYIFMKKKIDNLKKKYHGKEKRIHKYKEETKNMSRSLTKTMIKNADLEKYCKNYSRTMECIPTDVVMKLLNGTQCSICLTDSDRIGETVITSCFHVFHKRCLDRAMQDNKKCPMCRHDLTFTYSKNIQIGIEKKSVTNNRT